MTKECLWELRKQIKLCSLYYADYRNTFDIDEHDVCDFFDSYADYLEELMYEDIPGFDDATYFDHLSDFDNAENLWDWYGCYEWNPLPVRIVKCAM